MTLHEWLEKNDMSAYAFARKLGVTSGAVGHWLRGFRKPVHYYEEINAITDGKVTPNDFHGLNGKSKKKKT